jgi:hypothetical protein
MNGFTGCIKLINKGVTQSFEIGTYRRAKLKVVERM